MKSLRVALRWGGAGSKRKNPPCRRCRLKRSNENGRCWSKGSFGPLGSLGWSNIVRAETANRLGVGAHWVCICSSRRSSEVGLRILRQLVCCGKLLCGHCCLCFRSRGPWILWYDHSSFGQKIASIVYARAVSSAAVLFCCIRTSSRRRWLRAQTTTE